MGWLGTWEAQFETEGVFFRTPGSQASAFESGIQSDAVGRHTHSFTDQFSISKVVVQTVVLQAPYIKNDWLSEQWTLCY